MDDLISRQAAIDELKEHRALYCDNTPDTFSKLSYAEKSRVDELDTAIAILVNLPSAQPEWNNHTVACLLAELFDDTCACNYNDIDEWLPSKCELLDSCPNPVGVACWEQYLKHRAERRTDELGDK